MAVIVRYPIEFGSHVKLSFIHSFIIDQIKSDAFTVYRFRGTEQIKTRSKNYDEISFVLLLVLALSGIGFGLCLDLYGFV